MSCICPKCGTMYAAELKKCPKCGEPCMEGKNQQMFFLVLGTVMLVAATLIVVILLALSGSGKDDEKTSDTTMQTISSTATENEDLLITSDKEIDKTEENEYVTTKTWRTTIKEDEKPDVTESETQPQTADPIPVIPESGLTAHKTLTTKSAIDIYVLNKYDWIVGRYDDNVAKYNYTPVDLDFDSIPEIVVNGCFGAGYPSYQQKIYRIDPNTMTVTELTDFTGLVERFTTLDVKYMPIYGPNFDTFDDDAMYDILLEAFGMYSYTERDLKEYDIDLSSYKEYKVGDNHDDIKLIQERLYDLGYYYVDENEGYTSYFGIETEVALERFESDNDLAEDGIASYSDLLLLFPNDR